MQTDIISGSTARPETNNRGLNMYRAFPKTRLILGKSHISTERSSSPLPES
jgi:hypothetical protein